MNAQSTSYMTGGGTVTAVVGVEGSTTTVTPVCQATGGGPIVYTCECTDGATTSPTPTASPAPTITPTATDSGTGTGTGSTSQTSSSETESTNAASTSSPTPTAGSPTGGTTTSDSAGGTITATATASTGTTSPCVGKSPVEHFTISPLPSLALWLPLLLPLTLLKLASRLTDSR